jgi:exodeoxyribonuclease VII large subunit
VATLPSSIASLLTVPTLKKTEAKVWTVSELVGIVKRSLENQYREVSVVGEVSSFKAWRSGHWYFDLKDAQALLPAVMFKQLCSRVCFEVQDGMQVMVTGRVSIYAPQSKIQIIVDSMEPVGVGALALAFEQLKKKLEREGLFAEKSKKRLPSFPLRVGIITSPQGAVVQDMLRILTIRMPQLQVLIVPVRVQGQGAALEISDAIQFLDQKGNCDVMIVGRGGGSLEDLWAFNEEVVARAIFACQTPVVSAVGHETDFTIADFVADLRCATPTHAAQTVVPLLNDIVSTLDLRKNQIYRQTKSLLAKHHLKLEKIARRIKEPRLLMFQLMQRIDVSAMRLERVIRHLPNRERRKLDAIKHRLLRFSCEQHLVQMQNILSSHSERMIRALAKQYQNVKDRTHLCGARLSALSPLAVLSRGYSLLYRLNENGEKKVVLKLEQIRIKESLSVQLSDGVINVTVENLHG